MEVEKNICVCDKIISLNNSRNWEWGNVDMYEKFYEINSISYQIRIIKESDLDSLLLVKSDVSVHTDRFRQQEEGKAIYFFFAVKFHS